MWLSIRTSTHFAAILVSKKCSRRRRKGSESSRATLLRLQPERDFAHEAGVVPVGQPLRLRGDRGEQVGQGLHLRLGIIAEHVRGDLLLLAGAGVADADANPAEIRAEMGVDRAQAVVAR